MHTQELIQTPGYAHVPYTTSIRFTYDVSKAMTNYNEHKPIVTGRIIAQPNIAQDVKAKTKLRAICTPQPGIRFCAVDFTAMTKRLLAMHDK